MAVYMAKAKWRRTRYYRRCGVRDVGRVEARAKVGSGLM